MYHTQEKRASRLTQPVKCTKDDAWLGSGYYFWEDGQDAYNWGNVFKRSTGSFEIYTADINCENVLDTVFNEDHYRVWITSIEKVAKVLIKKTNKKPTIKAVNKYFVERGQWDSVTGIMFQDLPANDDYVTVPKFYYKKRIQLVAFKLNIVQRFSFYEDHQCNLV